jgi:hypothetical protein
MNPTAPVTARTGQAAAGKDRSRLWGVVCALLFLPAALAASVLALSSEQASRCVEYGEQCAHGLPWSVFEGAAGAGAVALLVVLAAATARVRQVALGVQILAEAAALLVILSNA